MQDQAAPTSFESLCQTLDSLKTKIQLQRASAESLSAGVGTLYADFELFRQTIGTPRQEIETLKPTIEILQRSTETLGSIIETLERTIGTLRLGIGTLECLTGTPKSETETPRGHQLVRCSQRLVLHAPQMRLCSHPPERTCPGMVLYPLPPVLCL